MQQSQRQRHVSSSSANAGSQCVGRKESRSREWALGLRCRCRVGGRWRGKERIKPGLDGGLTAERVRDVGAKAAGQGKARQGRS